MGSSHEERRCGRPTRSGKPCRNRVSQPGVACGRCKPPQAVDTQRSLNAPHSPDTRSVMAPVDVTSPSTSSDGFKYLPRSVDSRLAAALAEVPAVTLEGPRGVGKTTTALQFARSMIDLTDPIIAQDIEDDPMEALQGWPTPILIDEWQEAPSVLKAVKRAVDNSHSPGQFIITGSVRGDYPQQLPTTGRMFRIKMYPFTVREQIGKHGPALSERLLSGETLTTPESIPTTADYINLALRGGYPLSMTISDDNIRDGMLRSRVADTVNVDASIGRYDRSRLAGFLRAYAAHSGADGIVGHRKICSDAQISKDTGYAYRDLLLKTFLIAESPGYHTSRLKELQSTPKRYLIDSSLWASVMRYKPDDFRLNPPRRGQLIETFVAAQLRGEQHEGDYIMKHIRNRHGKEVDFLLDCGPRGVVSVEVKASRRWRKDHAKPMIDFARYLGKTFRRGVVLYAGQRPPRPVTRDRLIWAAPIATLWA